jgi:hypothetical protein
MIHEPSRQTPQLAPWVLWLAGLVAAFHPALFSGLKELQINQGDPRLVHYILEHSWLWVARAPHHEAFWSPPVFYPAKNVGAYSDTLVGTGPVYWSFRLAGFPAGEAFQLWMMACLSLAYLFAYLFFRRALAFGAWPAATAAFLFGFGITRLANFNSPQLFPIFWGALAVHAAARALATRSRAWIAAFFAALALQTWSTYYPTFFLVLVLGIAALSALLFRSSRAQLLALARARPVALAVAAVLCVAAVLPMVRAHLSAAEEFGWRGWGQVLISLPTPASWVFPGVRNLAWGWLSDLPAFAFQSPPSQHSNGVGFATSMLATAGLVLGRRRPIVRVAALTFAVVFALSLRVGDQSLWRWVYAALPGAGAIRYVARIGMYLPLLAGLGVALALERASARSRALAVALGTMCVLEQLHGLPGRDEALYRDEVRRVAARVDPECEAFVLTTVGAGSRDDVEHARTRVTHVFAMWVSVEARKPTLNGFYGNRPPDWNLMNPDLVGRREERAFEHDLGLWMRARNMDPERVQHISVPRESLSWLSR